MRALFIGRNWEILILFVNLIRSNFLRMKCFLIFLTFLFLSACRSEMDSHTVYKVDLENPDVIEQDELFSAVQVIPLETTEKSRFETGELGVKDGRYFILDREQQLFFCFDTTGKFRYVLDNKPKNGKEHASKAKSILTPLNYYYKKKWYSYLTFRNAVYTIDKEGNKKMMYEWDFGKYNDDRDLTLKFPPLQPQIVAQLQKVWMDANSAFALTDARQSDLYIYTSLKRNLEKDRLNQDSCFYHLICYKPTGKCYYFRNFKDGMALGTKVRLEKDCLLMLVSPLEKEAYSSLALLSETDREILVHMQDGDNPVLLKWCLRK